MLSPSTRNAALKLKSCSLSNATTVLQVVGKFINKQAKSTTIVKSGEAIKSGSQSVIRETDQVNSNSELPRTSKISQLERSINEENAAG